MKFCDIKNNSNIYLYAGENMYEKFPEYKNKTKLKWTGIWKDLNENLDRQNIGLINKNNPADNYNIKHRLLDVYDLNNNSVDIYQCEDILHYIHPNFILNYVNEIYRILKPGGLLRISVPDYESLKNINRCLRDDDGNILFDPDGGGSFKEGKVINGVIWFPTVKPLALILNDTLFNNIFYQSYTEFGISMHHKIDYNLGYVKNSEDFSNKKSIIVDLYKN